MRIASDAMVFLCALVQGLGGVVALCLCMTWWNEGRQIEAVFISIMIWGNQYCSQYRSRPQRHCFPSPWTGIDGEILDDHIIKELIERAELENSEMDWNWAQDKQRSFCPNGLIWRDRIVVVRSMLRMLEAQEQARKTSSSK